MGKCRNVAICIVIVLVFISIAISVDGFHPKAAFANPNQSIVLASAPKVGTNKFFNWLAPLVLEANAQIERDRETLLHYYGKARTFDLSDEEIQWTVNLAQRYRLKNTDPSKNVFWTELLTRVDIVPPALALAQAANESAYGTSRFARVANNYFGQWCFYAGCGVVPLSRASGSVHEVKKFATAKASVSAYLHNLNTNDAYQPFRNIRAKLRRSGDHLDPIELAKGLERYSAKGKRYVRDIHALIERHELHTL